MRTLAGFLVFVCSASAQFQSNVQLVVAPVTVTDSRGRYIDGLTPADLVLYDNNVPQPTQMDWAKYPISLVVAVQASENSGAVLDKLGTLGLLLTQLLAADAGETAVISYGDEVRIHQDFTGDADLLTRCIRSLHKEGDNAHSLDAMSRALQMLAGRPADRRRIILMIGEKRDRSSQTALPEVVKQVQSLNATVYWLTWSAFLEPFTARPKTTEDGAALPADLGPGGYAYAIGELIRMHKPDLASLFTTATGGRQMAFVKKNALEQAIQLISSEVHRQYVLTFEAKNTKPGEFHALRAAVKDHPELRARTRDGYWALR